MLVVSSRELAKPLSAFRNLLSFCGALKRGELADFTNTLVVPRLADNLPSQPQECGWRPTAFDPAGGGRAVERRVALLHLLLDRRGGADQDVVLLAQYV